MKGRLLFSVLKHIGETAVDIVDLFDVFLIAGYGASSRKIDFLFEKKKRNREKAREQAYERERYRKFLYKLRLDGLIEEKKTEGKRMIFLTKKGKEKYKKVSNGKEGYVIPSHRYKKILSKRNIIVIFDIPEYQKSKRSWLRVALKNLDFSLVQKSVWIGKNKIPNEFLGDLYKLNLVPYVQIFEVAKLGSLTQESAN